MQISVSKSGKLGRKMKVEVPADKMQGALNARFKKLAKQVKMDGFRKGKVPLNIVEQQYGPQVRREILGDMIKSSLIDALTQEKLKPAGFPEIEETEFESGKPLTYTAAFEVYPEIKLKPFSKIKIEKLTATVGDEDVNKTLDTLRGQYKDWTSVERKAKLGDQVDINFIGSIDGEEFDGGKAEAFKLELGTNKMIPGFEDGIVGMKKGEQKTIDVTFPKEYTEKSLADKKAQFSITVNDVAEANLPELNDAFAERLGIKEGGLEKLKQEIAKNMQLELERALKNSAKTQVMDALLAENKIDIPTALIDGEIERLQKQAEEMYGKHAALDDVKNKSKDIFEDEARRRVGLGLIIAEIVQTNEMKVNSSEVRKMIDDIAQAYQKPEEVVAMYYNDKQRLQGIESLVLEQQVVDTVLKEANIKEKTTTFEELVKSA